MNRTNYTTPALKSNIYYFSINQSEFRTKIIPGHLLTEPETIFVWSVSRLLLTLIITYNLQL